MKMFCGLTPSSSAFFRAGSSSSPWPRSAVKVMTSARYSVCSHLRMIDVSSPARIGEDDALDLRLLGARHGGVPGRVGGTYSAARATRNPARTPASRPRAKRGDDRGDLLVRRAARVDGHDPWLVWIRLFKRVELAAQERGRHILVMARRHSGPDERLRAFEVDEANVRPRGADAVAIGALERRAGHDPGTSLGSPAFELPADSIEPWGPVCVGQRTSLPHLLDIGGRMEPVALHERPA